MCMFVYVCVCECHVICLLYMSEKLNKTLNLSSHTEEKKNRKILHTYIYTKHHPQHGELYYILLYSKCLYFITKEKPTFFNFIFNQQQQQHQRQQQQTQHEIGKLCVRLCLYIIYIDIHTLCTHFIPFI